MVKSVFKTEFSIKNYAPKNKLQAWYFRGVRGSTIQFPPGRLLSGEETSKPTLVPPPPRPKSGFCVFLYCQVYNAGQLIIPGCITFLFVNCCHCSYTFSSPPSPKCSKNLVSSFSFHFKIALQKNPKLDQIAFQNCISILHSGNCPTLR